MSNHTTRAQYHINREERIQWLLAHPEMWLDWQVNTNDHAKIVDPRRPAIVAAMKADGVIAQSTYWRDVALNTLIKAAQKKVRLV